MLNSLRSAIDSWFSKVLLGILVLCFAVLWGAPQLTQNQGKGILKSGGTTLSLSDALLIDGDFRFRISLVSNGLQRFLSTPEANEIRPSVYAQMPIAEFLPLELRMRNDVVLKDTALQFKLGASKEVIRREINKDPFFRNGTNGFDRRTFDIYEDVLLRTYAGYFNSNDIIAQYAFDAKRDQLFAAISGDAKLPATFFKALNIYQNEKRTIDFITLSPAAIGALSISDADLEKWFDANQSRYIAPEYREITFVTLSPDQMKKTEEISDDDVKKFYDRNKNQFSRTEEARKLSVIHFATMQEATSAAKQLQEGKSFSDLATDLKKTAVSDEFSKTELPAPLADSLFALPQGGVSGIVDMAGPAIVHVDAILPVGQRPLEDVAAKVRDEIAKRNASAALNSTYEAVENDWFDGVSLAEIAQKYHLTNRTVVFDAQGKAVDGTVVEGLPQQQQLVQAAFQADIDTNQAPLAISLNGGYVWYQVNKIIAERNKTLSEVHDAALADWKTEETEKQLNEKAKTIKEELDQGKPLSQIASQMKIQTNTQTDLQRGKATAGFDEAGIKVIFTEPKGVAGVINGATPTERIVFQVVDVSDPAGGKPSDIPLQVREAANAGLRYDINNAVIQARMEEQKIVILNQPQFRQLTGGTGNE